jgi:SET domain-containing protein
VPEAGGPASAAALPGIVGKVVVKRHQVKGRCLVAAVKIAEGELIEAAPVVIVSAVDCAALDRTALGNYYFHWDGESEGDGRGAVALGYVGLCNHSDRPSARFERNPVEETIDLIALQPIAAGEEVTIDYNCPLWFEVAE